MGRGSSGARSAGKILGGNFATITEANVNKLIDMGAKRWQKGDHDRLYLSGIGEKAVGLDVSYYKTGNVSDAKLDGEHISNTQARRIIENIKNMSSKAYIDLKTGGIIGIQESSRTAYEKEKFIEFIDKYRKKINKK